MPGSLYNPNNVVVGHAVLWLAPWVAASVKPLVADTTPLFSVTAWETAQWFGAGATNEGFKINIETSTTTINIEEQSTPVAETTESKNINIEAALAESTMETIQLWAGGGTIVTAAAATGIPGTKKMFLSDDLLTFTAALETRNFNGFARRYYIPKMSLTGAGEVSFRRAAEKQTFPVRLASLCKPSEIQVVDITAAALP